MKDVLDCALLRQRATQCRLLADGVNDKQIRDRLIEIAIDYDAMARQREDTPMYLARRMIDRKRPAES